MYFHSALEGRKIESPRAESRVCFTVAGETEPVYRGGVATIRESVMAFGPALAVEDEAETHAALWALALKYLPACKDRAEPGIARTAVYIAPEARLTQAPRPGGKQRPAPDGGGVQPRKAFRSSSGVVMGAML